jgi:hypothetical protein
MTQPEMPLIQKDFFTYEGSKRLGRRSMKGGPWIEAELTRALEEQLAGLEVLNTENIWMKFIENLIVTSELIDRYKIFLYLRDM